MKESLLRRLEGLAERHAEITALLAEPDVIADQGQFRSYSIEYSRLGPLVASLGAWRRAQDDLAAAREMAGDADPEIRTLADDEIAAAEGRIAALEAELIVHLTPPDPHDESNVFLEIRAGTGGDEAAIFAGDLFRMYSRYAEVRGWQVEILSENPGEHGGYREIVARVVGRGVWSRLKFESGAHRVQRVPETEAQGRIHTSAATVAVMAEPDELEIPEINPADLRIDTYRASGAGGQHVNRTESAIRITHLPTGFVVECQDDRSQHKNRARAMGLLAAKIREAEEARRHAQQAETRKRLVGSGDRSERIRTYNLPQGRLTDHRINLTLYQLDTIMAGDLDPVIEPLIAEDRAEQLAAMGEQDR